MDKKYQVFISSTFKDLREERSDVVKAILSMGNIPVGMEMFNAGDDEQWKIIARHIDRSDFYVVLIAHRYGSMTPDGISYTEKEYDYAIASKIPVLGFILADDIPWLPERVDQEPETRAKLNQFKAKARLKMIEEWRDSKSLSGQVAIALMTQINTSDRPGWIRGDEAVGTNVLNELSRLSKENAELRAAALNGHLTLFVRDVVCNISERNKLRLKIHCTFDGTFPTPFLIPISALKVLVRDDYGEYQMKPSIDVEVASQRFIGAGPSSLVFSGPGDLTIRGGVDVSFDRQRFEVEVSFSAARFEAKSIGFLEWQASKYQYSGKSVS